MKFSDSGNIWFVRVLGLCCFYLFLLTMTGFLFFFIALAQNLLLETRLIISAVCEFSGLFFNLLVLFYIGSEITMRFFSKNAILVKICLGISGFVMSTFVLFLIKFVSVWFEN